LVSGATLNTRKDQLGFVFRAVLGQLSIHAWPALTGEIDCLGEGELESADDAALPFLLMGTGEDLV